MLQDAKELDTELAGEKISVVTSIDTKTWSDVENPQHTQGDILMQRKMKRRTPSNSPKTTPRDEIESPGTSPVAATRGVGAPWAIPERGEESDEEIGQGGSHEESDTEEPVGATHIGYANGNYQAPGGALAEALAAHRSKQENARVEAKVPAVEGSTGVWQGQLRDWEDTVEASKYPVQKGVASLSVEGSSSSLQGSFPLGGIKSGPPPRGGRKARRPPTGDKPTAKPLDQSPRGKSPPRKAPPGVPNAGAPMINSGSLQEGSPVGVFADFVTSGAAPLAR